MPIDESKLRKELVDGLMESIAALVKTSINLVTVVSTRYISKGEFEKVVQLHKDIQETLSKYNLENLD